MKKFLNTFKDLRILYLYALFIAALGLQFETNPDKIFYVLALGFCIIFVQCRMVYDKVMIEKNEKKLKKD